MIRGAFHHLPGLGPGIRARLEQEGVRDWRDLLSSSERLPLSRPEREKMVEAIFRCEQALEENDLHTLIRLLKRSDHWRLLNAYLDRASFFDIETDGIGGDSRITVIACFGEGQLKVFMRDEGFEEFLSWMDQAELLVSFNGDSFDVPRLEREFHIPKIPCPHLDLRWICYHAGLKGGLKNIEKRTGIQRPADLEGIDGAEAERLWRLWTVDNNSWARDILKRYCGADTLALRMVSEQVLKSLGCPLVDDASLKLWSLLGPPPERPPAAAQSLSPAVMGTPIKRTQQRMQNMRALLKEHRKR
ncbi:MAG: ribonuclease H-like domain-containing protein [Lentisphaerota bacterium]